MVLICKKNNSKVDQNPESKLATFISNLYRNIITTNSYAS